MDEKITFSDLVGILMSRMSDCKDWTIASFGYSSEGKWYVRLTKDDAEKSVFIPMYRKDIGEVRINS